MNRQSCFAKWKVNRFGWLLALICLPPAQAGEVVCHVVYGGEATAIAVAATDTPLTAPAHPIGSYFLFRPVVEKHVAVKIYVYADRAPDVPLPLHQAVHPWPVSNTGRYGFTGLNFVYEPLRDGELEYWCALR